MRLLARGGGTLGFHIQSLILTPELVPDEVIYAAFEALAAGAPD